MTATVLCAARVAGWPGARWLAVEDGIVAAVGHGEPPSGAQDLGEAVLAPGLVDVQVNGIGDTDFNEPALECWTRGARRLLEHGVTTFFPTLISQPRDRYEALLLVAAQAREATRGDMSLAEIAGVHLEGPFLGGAPGAHRREDLSAADPAWIGSLLAAHEGLVSIVTLAPEADPGLGLTRMLASRRVVVSLGHSTASYDEAIAAADAGASAVTHLFNGMSPLHHRQPGLAGAALDDPRLTPSLIADLVHVHPAAMKIAAARKRNVVLVSDSIATGTEWTRSRGVEVLDGAPRLPDGTLAGSVLTLDTAVLHAVGIGIDLDRAIEMASSIPAELVGLADRGRLRAGGRADIVALGPHDVSVRAVWRAGERVR